MIQNNNNQDLPLKYRPKTIEDVVGNPVVKKVIKGFVDSNNFPHCILLEGERGTGKTSIARIIGSYLECLPINFREMGSSTDRSLESMRAIEKASKTRPMGGKSKVFFIDEAHSLLKASYEALLKQTEEPPEHSYYIFATTNKSAIPKDLLSRCTQLSLKPLSELEIGRDLLLPICKKEDIKFSNNVLKNIAKVTQGIPREAIVLLNKVRYLSEEEALEESASFRNTDIDVFTLTMDLLFNRKPVDKIISGFANIDMPPESIRFAILGILEKMTFKEGVTIEKFKKYTDMAVCFEESYNDTGKMGLAISIYNYKEM